MSIATTTPRTDLTTILLATADEIEFSGDIPGLIKTYEQPFSASEEGHPDAREALAIEDPVMARYGKPGEILLIHD